jgi:hypothetical protein
MAVELDLTRSEGNTAPRSFFGRMAYRDPSAWSGEHGRWVPTRKARRAAASRTPHWLVGISQHAVSLLLTRGCEGTCADVSFLFLRGNIEHSVTSRRLVEETLITVLILRQPCAPG